MKLFKKIFSGVPVSEQTHGLQLTQQQVSSAIASLLMSSFFIFIGGYYWGKKQAAEKLSTSLQDEFLADKVYTALHTGDTHAEAEQDEPLPSSTKAPETPSRQYYAQLGKFSSALAARAYIKKLENVGCPATLVEHESATARGKKSHTWYQVVTPLYTEQEELKELLNQIREVAHPKDISIIADESTNRKA